MLRRIAIYAVFILCFLSSVNLYGQIQTPTKPSKEPQKQAGESQQKAKIISDAANSPFVSLPFSVPQNIKIKTIDNTSNENNKSSADWWLVYFTAAIVAIIFLQFIWMVRQEKWMRRNVEIAKEAADAAKDSAHVARDSLTSIRRAFVSFKNITTEPATIDRGLEGYKEMQHWGFNPCWINMGDTPTKNLTISVNWKVFDYQIPYDFDFPYDNRPNATTNIPMAIGPKGEVICGAFALHYLRILEPIMGLQDKNLYIWGEAIYDDIFDKPHRTRFCVKMIFVTQQIVGGHDKPTFIFYDRYNCYDDDCVEQS